MCIVFHYVTSQCKTFEWHLLLMALYQIYIYIVIIDDIIIIIIIIIEKTDGNSPMTKLPSHFNTYAITVNCWRICSDQRLLDQLLMTFTENKMHTNN